MKSRSKGKDKKRLRVVLLKVILLVMVVFLLWSGWKYTKPDNFPIKNVKIFATYEHVEKLALQDAVKPYLDSGFFYLNVIGLKKRLLDFPWIYAVSIKRQWPDKLLINIVEERAVLQWGSKALINSFGKIFTPSVTTFSKDLPIIFGPEDRYKEILELYNKMNRSLEPLDLNVKRLLLNPRHYWEILLSNGVVVYLKENEPLPQLSLITDFYRKITADRKDEPKSIDMRYQSGFAVKW